VVGVGGGWVGCLGHSQAFFPLLIIRFLNLTALFDPTYGVRTSSCLWNTFDLGEPGKGGNFWPLGDSFSCNLFFHLSSWSSLSDRPPWPATLPVRKNLVVTGSYLQHDFFGSLAGFFGKKFSNFRPWPTGGWGDTIEPV